MEEFIKMVVMFDLMINRSWLYPTDGDYSLYENALKEKLQALEDTRLIRSALINEDLIKKMQTALENEIKYCQFHKEYFDCMTNEVGFNEWVFTENVESRYWDKTIGNEWTRTNGRIKAIIRIIPPEIESKRTRIELNYYNDSKVLTFINRDQKEKKVYNLKNAESIRNKVNELKGNVDEGICYHKYPIWNPEKANLNGLNKILHIPTKTVLNDPSPT